MPIYWIQNMIKPVNFKIIMLAKPVNMLPNQVLMPLKQYCAYKVFMLIHPVCFTLSYMCLHNTYK